MLWTKIKTGVIGVLAMAVVMTGLGQALYTASGQTKGPGADAPRDAAAVEIVQEGLAQGKSPKTLKKESPSRGAQELEKKLLARDSFQYRDATLGEVLDHLRKAYDINIFLDEKAILSLYPDAVPKDLNVNAQLKDVPLDTALRFVLKSTPLSKPLGYVIQDDILVVTTLDKTMMRKVYPVGNLLGNDEEKNAVALIQVIINTIEPESWTLVSAGVVTARAPNEFAPIRGGGALGGLGGALGQLGGGIGGIPNPGAMLGGGGMFGMGGMFGTPPAQVQPPRLPNEEGAPATGHGASIAYFPGTKTLVVRQYLEVHREIEELLKNLAEK